jgi:hypothetical protein
VAQVKVGWLKPPEAIGGIDHLGTQAPCIMVYSALLPGVTNVTDRARYYSFYAWVIWSFERRYLGTNSVQADFVEHLRRADCLFTLVAERHSKQTDNVPERHGAAMAGRNELLPALRDLELGRPLDLAEFAGHGIRRYFKNRLGGLGQYYIGTLAQLNILEVRRDGWPAYTPDRGRALAEAFDAFVQGELFWEVCSQGFVSLVQLDALATFCPCNLCQSEKERETLLAMCFAAPPFDDTTAPRRRETLQLLMHLTQMCSTSSPPVDLSALAFRGAVYCHQLPNGSHWDLPEHLQVSLRKWGVYQASDILSVAFQGLFTAGLLQMEADGPRHQNVDAFVSDFLGKEWVVKVLSGWRQMSLAEASQEKQGSGALQRDWFDPDHEVQLAESLVSWGVDATRQSARLRAAIDVLITLLVKLDTDPISLSDMGAFAEELRPYPINILSFQQRVRGLMSQSVDQVVGTLLQWAMQTHLRVALRKLRQTGTSSFRFYLSELGLVVVSATGPAHTVPRFRQGMQMLRDLKLIERDASGVTKVSADGQAYVP